MFSWKYAVKRSEARAHKLTIVVKSYGGKLFVQLRNKVQECDATAA
jgi:hypothetical protein